MKENLQTVKVWDPFVRFFHWTLVFCIIGQFITAEDFRKCARHFGVFHHRSRSIANSVGLHRPEARQVQRLFVQARYDNPLS